MIQPIDTTQLPPHLRELLADRQPITWIPLPASHGGTASMTIPVHTQATPRLMDPWLIDKALTSPATQVYRWIQENMGALVHGHTVTLVKASDTATLTSTLQALTHQPVRMRNRQPEPDIDRKAEGKERSR